MGICSRPIDKITSYVTAGSVGYVFPYYVCYVLVVQSCLTLCNPMNKASGGDGIPVELFQILKDDAVKVLHSIC